MDNDNDANGGTWNRDVIEGNRIEPKDKSSTKNRPRKENNDIKDHHHLCSEENAEDKHEVDEVGDHGEILGRDAVRPGWRFRLASPSLLRP